MDTREQEDMLTRRGIKPTSIRILVLRTMLSHQTAFSLPSLENELDTVDKSTLSRTIKLFRDHCMIHSIDDGSGSVKYSVCRHEGECTLDDQHVHFHCSRCGNTFCLESISVPTIPLPENFRLENVNFVVKGICGKCSR